MANLFVLRMTHWSYEIACHLCKTILLCIHYCFLYLLFIPQSCWRSLPCMSLSPLGYFSTINGSNMVNRIFTKKKASMLPSKIQFFELQRLMPAHAYTLVGCLDLHNMNNYKTYTLRQLPGPFFLLNSKLVWGFPVGWWLHHSICPETHPHSLPCIGYIAHLIRLVYLSSWSVSSILCFKKSNLKFPKRLQNDPYVDIAMSLR